MRTALPKQATQPRSHRPRAVTVFAAAFVAGAAAAVGVNRTLDVRLAQAKPRVESEAIFVALRSLPQGAPVTVWDVALRDWPKAMMPATALRASDTFSGQLLKHPLREGQPLLSIQLLPAGQETQPAADSTPSAAPTDYTRSTTPVVPAADTDLWAPVEPVKIAALPLAPAAAPAQPTVPPAQPTVPEAAPPATAPMHEPPAAAAQATASGPQEVAATPAPPVVAPQEAEPQVEPPKQQEVAVATEPAVSEPAVKEPAATESAVGEATVPDTAASAAVTESTARDADDTITSDEVAGQPETVVPDAHTAATESATPAAEEPTVATEAAPMPIAAAPTSPPPAASRPVHSRYLVVPESIALKADTSFVKRADAPQSAAESTQHSSARPASNSVRPLPPTATATATSPRSPQPGRPQARVPQGGPPQRQGRQTAPVNTRHETEDQPQPQPRFGTTMFPNLSAGMNAFEERLRRGSAEQQQASPSTKPITVR